MALIDYGVIIFKNNKMITEDCILDNEVIINGKKFSIYPKGINAIYDEKTIYEFWDSKHPFRKIEMQINNVYFMVKKIDTILYIYIRNQHDVYKVFSGYGIDTDWKYFSKEYYYPKKVLKMLRKIEKEGNKK